MTALLITIKLVPFPSTAIYFAHGFHGGGTATESGGDGLSWLLMFAAWTGRLKSWLPHVSGS